MVKQISVYNAGFNDFKTFRDKKYISVKFGIINLPSRMSRTSNFDAGTGSRSYFENVNAWHGLAAPDPKCEDI